MQWRNSSSRYGIISMCLHWLFALAVYAMFGLGLWMVTLSYYDGWYHQAPELHKSIGVLLMMGLVFRIIWRHVSPPPPAPKATADSPASLQLAHTSYSMPCCWLFLSAAISFRPQTASRLACLGFSTSPPRWPMRVRRLTPPVWFICGWHGAL
ncbi:unnamed protein product [Callosobruchus maculatus]|uniref:Cytochrome b561 bacterial/Ni-hydrogenase domain-containing protein n=1 Tax=Callosobruchus maculatus TaxID=64391 RepID=A0A653BPG8_CALMS|nr:unnamed protein product [Callosobruchus maculatus]